MNHSVDGEMRAQVRAVAERFAAAWADPRVREGA